MDRSLPDPELHLRDAADFILGSNLGRMALSSYHLPRFPLLARDMLGTIHRLTASCSLPEFTDHGLIHICSLVDRISRWTCAAGSSDPILLCDSLDTDLNEPAVLLLATLFHDLGMLSQKAEDLGPEHSILHRKSHVDFPVWVRSTHITRLRRLVLRLLRDSGYADLCEAPIVQRAINVAIAHGAWPWKKEFTGLAKRDGGLAAVLAVADLLDEDANRCDTVTLLQHRQGTMLNAGHWLRHGLTDERLLVVSGIVSVHAVKPPGTGATLAPVFAALRNHFRLALLYRDALAELDPKGLVDVVFQPPSGLPHDDTRHLSGWADIHGLSTEQSLLFHLLMTFMPFARMEDRAVPSRARVAIDSIGREPVDVRILQRVMGKTEKRSPDEQAFYAIRGGPDG
jgi:hypothetical protein